MKIKRFEIRVVKDWEFWHGFRYVEGSTFAFRDWGPFALDFYGHSTCLYFLMFQISWRHT